MNELQTEPAAVTGEASVVRAVDKLQAQAATLRATVHITRKETGLVETYEIIGTTASQEGELP